MKPWRRKTVYLLTLPERMLRAFAASLGGVLFVFADLIVPRAIQRTTIYYLLLGGGMRYAVERLAGMSTREVGTDSLPPLPEQYQRRKLAGTAIEVAGLLTVGFSPLWVFAIAGDAAAGSKVFLHRLEGHLKKQGVIEQDAMVDDLTDLLDALQAASLATTTVLDTPPLSRKDLEQLTIKIRRSYAQVFAGTRNLAGRLERILERMDGLTDTHGIDIERLNTLMAGEVLANLKRGRATVKAVQTASTELFGEQILEGYRKTLDEATKVGWGKYLVSAYRPFLEAARHQLTGDAYTWTGKLLIR